MSKYTTGEMARLCDVSVRTVQYYDTRGILTPSELSEGGRRLYSEEDLRRMKVICFLREVGFSINSIGTLFAEEDPGSIIALLLDQQEMTLRAELAERKSKLDMLETIRHELKGVENVSVDSIADIAHVMKKKNDLRKLRTITLLTGLPVSALQWVSILLWITNGLWWLFAIWCGVATA